MFSIDEPTRDDIWAEAQRLEQPIYHEGKELVRDRERMLGWARRAGIATTTLACFADWDPDKLRATAREHRMGGEGSDQPCGYHLCVAAALLSDKPPAARTVMLPRARCERRRPDADRARRRP
ncbi:MAG TPA: hypothetical protein VIA11_16675 [Acidimicrobiia bacterium]|nr:hypothetical protein [Acidimicrobiia bacterium]